MSFCDFVHWPNIGCKLLLHIRNLIWPNIKLAMKEQIEAEAVSVGQGCVTDCRSGIGLNVRKGVFPSDFLPLQLCLFAVVRGGFEKHSGKHTQIHRHTHTHTQIQKDHPNAINKAGSLAPVCGAGRLTGTTLA